MSENTCVHCGTNEAVVLVTCEDESMIFVCEKCLHDEGDKGESNE